MTDNLDAWVEWGNANLPDWHGGRAMPSPDETRLNLIDGVEYITLRADDFRVAMRERDALRAENERLRAVMGQVYEAGSSMPGVSHAALVEPLWHALNTDRLAKG